MPVNLSRNTLNEILNNWFFENNPRSFLVIYDTSSLLIDFFQEQEGKHENFCVLSIEATTSPSEIIDREKIVNDFDDDVGWYRHKWIIHVYGIHAVDVEKTATFNYYMLIGEGYILSNFFSLLEKIHLINTKRANSILDEKPEINKVIIKILGEIPLSCYISEEGECYEQILWLVYLTSDPGINPTKTSDSPIWASLATTRTTCSYDKVFLDLIYRINPFNPNPLEENSIKGLHGFFKMLLDEWALKEISLSEDWFENLSKFIWLLFQYGKPPAEVKPIEKKKGGSLDAFLVLRTDKSIPESTIQAFQNLMGEWMSNADETLATRFQHWTFLNRKKQQLVTMDKNELQDNLTSFTFTGMFDINIALNILNHLRNEPQDPESWITYIDEIIKKREKLWKKATRVWWSQKSLLFAPNKNQYISIKEFWFSIRYIGHFLLIKFPESTKWEEISSIAWQIETLHLSCSNPTCNAIFSDVEYFNPLIKFLNQLEEKYKNFNQQLNVLFVKHYSTLITQKETRDGRLFENAFWKRSIDYINKDNTIGFLFCDALRKDLASELVASLEHKAEQNLSSILESSRKIEVIEIPGIIPSVTHLGWSRALQHNGKIFIKISGDNLISGVDVNGEKKILTDPKSREGRLTSIFLGEGKNVEVQHLDITNFNNDLDVLREKIVDRTDHLIIPIMWFDKFDNHDFSLQDFINQRTTIITELTGYIFKLHEVGIKTIHILTDHGFIFTSNEKLLDKKPDGKLHKRHCVSPHFFTDDEIQSQKDWQIFPIDKVPFSIEENDLGIKSIILPRDDFIFKKSKNDGQFFIHGGLSFQECDMLHITSHCEFKPMVEIEYLEPRDHEHIEVNGEKQYYLKEMGTSKYLQIQLQTKKKHSEELLRPLTFKVTCEDPRINVDKSQEITVPSGAARNFVLSFNKNLQISTITVCIRNPDNEIIKKTVFHLQEPSVYAPNSLF